MDIENIGLAHFLIVSSIIFSVGVAGLFFNRRNVITILMSIELMLLAININFVAFSVQLQDVVGQIFSILILSIAAAEVSIGLAILVVYYRNLNSIEIEEINQMQG